MTAGTLSQHLQTWSDALDALEKEALAELRERHNQTAYRDLMRRRAELLRSLPEKAEALPEGPRSEASFAYVKKMLERFAQGAANALSIDSVFYMSALLYPDEHKPGEPNNLQRLILDISKQ